MPRQAVGWEDFATTCIPSMHTVSSCKSHREMVSTAMVTVSPSGGLEHGDGLGAGMVVHKIICREHVHEGVVV